jgi:tryptophanyl-tRNA synthetase
MRVCSGIQPTGVFHLGNYFGALVNWVQMQQEGHECFFFIANQHAITLPQDSTELKKQTLNAAATILASGIDPEKSTLFVQSDVPEHTQLAWILNCLAPMGQMERMIQFKEKSEKNPTSTNVGLFSYPILQAADILLYKADTVPVGIDQAQHLELSRILAKKFNTTYKEIFPEPKTLHTKTTKIMGLDGKNKMSKSLNNHIGLTEDPKDVWAKVKTAATDPARVKKTDPGNPEICNVYSLHKLFSTENDKKWVVDGCTSANIGCIECKKKLFENMETFLKPIREKYNSLIQDQNKLKEILDSGAEKARTVAKETLAEVYDAVGFKY